MELERSRKQIMDYKFAKQIQHFTLLPMGIENNVSMDLSLTMVLKSS